MREIEPLTAKTARATWAYDPETGILRWRIRPAPCVRVGDIAGSVNSNGYLKVDFRGRTYAAHRLAFLIAEARWPRGDLDHRDLVKSNNRRDNRREATRSQNVANVGLRLDNSSGFRGVTRRRSGSRPWRAVHVVDGVRHSLGDFSTAEEAGAAYAAFVAEHRGEFARCK
jgi:hypothetical protein